MCGRFVYYSQPSLLREELQEQAFDPAYNITPGYMTPVVARLPQEQVVLMKWGLVPYWAKDPKVGYKTINARADGIADKPSFRRPIRSQRCLVLANGFYEWQTTTVGGRQTKVPHFIRVRDRDRFAFAGIYDLWRDADGNEMRSYAIITTRPNELMATIHNRMPVILPAEQEDAWLDGSTALDTVLAMLRPYPAATMEAYPVSRLVNDPHNNGPDLILPAARAEAEQSEL